MDANKPNMGRNPGIRAGDVFEIMETRNRPVWTARNIAEVSDVSRPTAAKRLKKMDDDGELETVEVGNATAYYLPGIETKPADPDTDPVKQDLRRAFEDRFVGLFTEPWTAVHPNDGPAVGGDRVQIQVEGSPGNWGQFKTRLYENRRQELRDRETNEREVQALISGELYEKPTVPIEHMDYPDDYALELNVGGAYKEIEGRDRPVLIAAGVKNYLLKPCDNAVFLQNVSVDWVAPEGAGQELPTTGVSQEDLVDLAESRDQDEALEELLGDVDAPAGEEPEAVDNTQKTYEDIITLSGSCAPRRALLAQKPLNDGYRVIPADATGEEMGRDYEPTEEFKREVRAKTAVDGDLQFQRTWLEE